VGRLRLIRFRLTEVDLCDLPERIRDKVMPEPNSGCWLWIGTLKNGYGLLGHEYAHRLVMRLSGKEVSGLVLDHICHTPCCVNPFHLKPGTQADNCLTARPRIPKTHCPKGHPYSGSNLRIDAEGYKRCRLCDYHYHARYRAAGRRKQYQKLSDAQTPHAQAARDNALKATQAMVANAARRHEHWAQGGD